MTAPAARAHVEARPLFAPVTTCWVCGERKLVPYHTLRFELDAFLSQDQDRELAGYTGQTLDLVRCARCGFGQPAALPTLDRYFDRMYDQRWDEAWVVREFEAEYKDLIFHSILKQLERRVRSKGRRLLDVGAHAGRFLHLARTAGWDAEGIELNPRTAAYAAIRTGLPVHNINAQSLADRGRTYDAVVLTDVLEHIPQPVQLIKTLASLTEAGGVVAVKVPCGRSQVVKEQVLAAISSHRVSLADNLVHVNHFSPRSLRLALERAGFSPAVRTAAPELRPLRPLGSRALASNAAQVDDLRSGATARRSQHAVGPQPPSVRSAATAMSRMRKAAMGAAFGYMHFGFAIVTGIFLVPLTLYALGARTWGLWLASTEVLDYAGMVDLGVLSVLAVDARGSRRPPRPDRAGGPRVPGALALDLRRRDLHRRRVRVVAMAPGEDVSDGGRSRDR